MAFRFRVCVSQGYVNLSVPIVCIPVDSCACQLQRNVRPKFVTTNQITSGNFAYCVLNNLLDYDLCSHKLTWADSFTTGLADAVRLL